MFVHTDWIDYVTELILWGRDPAGHWWGLCRWTAAIAGEHGPEYVECRAWLPATNLTPAPHEHRAFGSRGYLRLTLPADRNTWPSVIPKAGRPWHDYGILTGPAEPLGQKLDPMAG